MIRTQKNKSTFAVLLALVFLITAAGCAGNSMSANRNVTVIVENTSPSFLTIWAAPRTGIRVRVGEAPANQTSTLRFSPTLSGSYRLVAEQLSGVEMVSNDVSIYPGVALRWNLTSNIAIEVVPED